MKSIWRQDIGDDPISVRETDHYQAEYVRQFVGKWDDLIDWEARAASEGNFFIDELRRKGARRVLDAAAGTGFHSVLLIEAGFEVTSADGNSEMLIKAFANGRRHGHILRTIQTDWRCLNSNIDEKFDAVICLGNSFTHLFSEQARRKTLAEFYAALRHDGVLILDHRNYDVILDGEFRPNHNYYYCARDVKVYPEHVDPGLARFCYEFPDSSSYHLNMFPLRKHYVTDLMKQAGFEFVTTYGDFQADFRDDEPDFFVHVAEKTPRKRDVSRRSSGSDSS